MNASLPFGPTASSQVNIPHVRRGAGLVQFILRLGAVPLVLTELLQAVEQHHLDLLLAGFEAVLEGERGQTRAVSKTNGVLSIYEGNTHSGSLTRYVRVSQ